MTYANILAAASVLQKLIHEPLHLRQAYHLTKIVSRANEELEFYQRKQKEIMAGDFDDKERAKKMNELLNFEIDWPLEPLLLSLDDDIRLTSNDLIVSKGIIEVSE